MNTDQAPEAGQGSESVRLTEQRLRGLEYRDLSLWISATLVMLLLAFGVYSFSGGPTDSTRTSWLPDLGNAARGLCGLVLLFALFAIYKQVQINRLRRQLAAQMKLAAAFQTRAELFHKLAILDPLTGLYNRRFVIQHLPVELARAERQHYKLTALMFDLNGLKHINDTHSHLAGDLAIREFATSLRRAIRSSDLAVRLGGDEFLVILPECEAVAVPRVLARMDNLQVKFREEKIRLTFSAGWAEHLDGEGADELLARADQRLYEDKRTGIATTQTVAMQQQLRQAEKMEVMGRLTSSVAHDFNTLLTIIRGYAELAMSALEPAHALRTQLEQIQKAAVRASRLTGQLLAFSRKQALQPKLLNINTVLASMEMMLGRLLGDRVQLQMELGSDLHSLRVDVGQIEQVLMNLLANARDAMPRGGQARITTSNFTMDEAFVGEHPGARAGEYVRLEVNDNGVGMDPATQSRIFEPFFTTKEPGKGTGLGLSTVYGAVKQNGGYIWVDSKPDRGTRVVLYLPRAAAPAPTVAASTPVAPTAHLPADDQPTVLVVEAFEALRSFMCEFLHSCGYRTLEAVNGEQAVQLATDHETSINLMICDFLLPGMSGLELSEWLASGRREIPVLYIAGYIDDATLYSACRGSSDMLVAPFSPDEFSHKVRELLSRRSPAAAVAEAR